MFIPPLLGIVGMFLEYGLVLKGYTLITTPLDFRTSVLKALSNPKQ